MPSSLWKSLLRTKDKIITKKFDHVKSGVTIYLFSPLSIFLQTLLWRDFSPLVGYDCDKNDGYTIVDRYIRHGDSREELEVPEYIADTCSHDGASLPGKTRFDQTCNSLSFFLYLFLVLEREKRRREKSRLVLNLTRENRRLITRDKLYTVGWRERRKDCHDSNRDNEIHFYIKRIS